MFLWMVRNTLCEVSYRDVGRPPEEACWSGHGYDMEWSNAGFHLTRMQLDNLLNAEEAYLRRGADWTFDADQFVESIRDIRHAGLCVSLGIGTCWMKLPISECPSSSSNIFNVQ